MKYDFDAKMDEFLPLRDVVFGKLRQSILTGELKPGERLMEIHLADKLGVSRTPIREAIRKLELEGLVIMIPRRGAVVADITEKSMKDVLEVRRALDTLSVDLACQRISEEDKLRLKNACDEFEKAVAEGDLRRIAAKDVELHNIIVESTQNERLVQMMNNLSEQMFRYRFEYIKNNAQHDQLIAEHRKIYEGIAGGDHKTASTYARLHIDNQEKAILEQIRFERGRS